MISNSFEIQHSIKYSSRREFLCFLLFLATFYDLYTPQGGQTKTNGFFGRSAKRKRQQHINAKSCRFALFAFQPLRSLREAVYAVVVICLPLKFEFVFKWTINCSIALPQSILSVFWQNLTAPCSGATSAGKLCQKTPKGKATIPLHLIVPPVVCNRGSAAPFLQ
jgi:hypothetical protein